MKLTRSSALVGALIVFTAIPGASVRADVSLPLIVPPSPRVHVDGWLQEWTLEGFTSVGTVGRMRVRIALAPSSSGLYVAASVDDDRMVRSSTPSMAEDALVLRLAAPSSSGELVSTELTFFAGVPESVAALLTVSTGGVRAPSVRGATVVEMPTSAGYDLEAYIPWEVIPGARDWARARAIIQLHDVDVVGGPGRDVSSSSDALDAPATWPRVAGNAGELFPLGTFLHARRAAPDAIEVDIRANFSGDAVPERVVVAAGTLAIFGASYAGGRDFDYADLGLPEGCCTQARAVDLDGDSISELVLLTARVESGGDVRELRVFRFPGDRIESYFRAEIGLGVGVSSLESAWNIEEVSGRLPIIRIAAATGTGGIPRHVAEAGVVPLLQPGAVLSRSYGFAGGSFGRLSEQLAPPPVGATAPPVPPVGSTRSGAERTNPLPAARGQTSAPSANPAATPPPVTSPPGRPTSGSFDSAPLLAAVRHDRGIAPDVSVRFSASADLAEDSRAEEVHVLGESLIVVGPGYRGGVGYYALDLGVASPEQIVGVTLADVTGDGKAEVWVSVRQPIGTPPMYLELSIVFRMTADGLAPIFTGQAAIGDGTREVRNELRAATTRRILELVVTPGTATGFDARTFPFSTTAISGMTTLLLPWRDSEQRYRWDGSALVGI